MNVADLEKRIRESKASGATPLMVCATAGTTVRGAFDPIHAIAEISSHYHIWLHVDVRE